MRLDRLAVAVLALAVTVAMLPVPVPAATTTPTQSPSVSVHVGNTPLDVGDEYHTANDPWIRIDVSADASISLVELRVNGTTRHVFEPGSDSFSRSVPLDLVNGHHRVTVVAKADGVTTHTATIVKDDIAPWVTYESPISGLPVPLYNDTRSVTVTNSSVTISGSIRDDSTIRNVRIDHAYAYAPARNRDGDYTYDVEAVPDDPDQQLPAGDHERREQHVIPSPGDSFNESLTLALGTNYIRVVVTDAVGNTRAEHFVITVEDETRPTLNVTHVRYVSPTRLHVEGWASDSVQVNDVWLQEHKNVTDANGNQIQNATVRHRMVFRQPTIPNPDRKRVRFNTTVYHPPDTDYLVVGANDTALNQRIQNYSLSRWFAPNVTIDRQQTGYIEGRTVAVGGRVAGGQVSSVSVEAIDPSSGRIVDITPVALGENGTFGARLEGVPDRTRLRVRVTDVIGTNHLKSVTVSEPADDPATPSTNGTAEPTAEPTATPAESDADESGVRIPFVGIVVPVPDVFGASLSVPVPFVGSVSVPLAPAGALGVAVVGVVAWIRRRF